MFRKFHFFLLSLLLSSIFCFTNTFADENGDPINIENIIAEGNFEFPTADGANYIQGNAEFQRVPDYVIGDPDFEKMRDLPPDSQDYQLGRKVGMLFIRDRFGAGSVCTGFLVGPDLFMTNHHCMYDDFGPHPLSTAFILMDYYQDLNVDPTGGGITARVSEILRADAEKDYALLRLDSPIGNTYGWLELDTTITYPDASQSVKLIAHSDARSKEIVRRNSQIIDIPLGHPLFGVPSAIAYLADSEGGSSGAPVFLRDGTGVIAIHHSGWTRRGAPYHNAGSLMFYIVPEIQQYLPSDADSEYADLVVEAPLLTNNYLLPGESFTLSATVRNQGTGPSTATTLRFYQSTDTTVTISDLEIGTADVGPLNPGETSEINITLTAPMISGTHHYHACVDTVDNEASDNNCSPSVTLTVLDTPPEPGPGPGPVDVDGDGQVTVVDLVIVALSYGTQVPAGVSIPADVNADGTVNIADLVAVAEAIDAADNGGTDGAADDVAAVLAAVAEQVDAIEAAPEAPALFSTSQHALRSGVAARNVAAAFEAVKHLATDDVRLGKWMPLFKELLQLLTEMREIPDTTVLLPNYPNPFNPETWIPYRLATDAEVVLTIYDTRGIAVRALTLGHQTAGVYQSKHRAAYWDGRNDAGEKVSSGLYFYTLTTGNFTATRKLLIIK